MFLSLESVSVRYPRSAAQRAAVEGVSLGLQAGQIGVLIGPSGCGKTSLLRAVAGLERCAAGRVSIGEQVLSDAAAGVHRAPEQRQIGMVFQDYALFPHLSVAENVAFGVAGLDRSARSQRVQQMLDLVGLGLAARRAPHQLSGGQQQRVALARALAPGPRLLLLTHWPACVLATRSLCTTTASVCGSASTIRGLNARPRNDALSRTS